jgi:exopolyphosphatase/guanosine-5'-triphosphate,3'-diphosphate pyrophosphatase
LGRKNRLALAKLTGILRLANAMDYSHRRKLKNVKVSIHSGRLVIAAGASQNATLENWKMQSFVEDIQDVFGLRLEFSIKRGH